MEFKNHDLVDGAEYPGTRYEKAPLYDAGGEVVEGLHVIRITLDNPGNNPTHYHLALERLDDNERMHTYYGGKNVDLWRRYRLANRSEERYRQLLADVAGESNTVRRLEVSTSISRSSDNTIREIRISSAGSSFDDIVCRL